MLKGHNKNDGRKFSCSVSSAQFKNINGGYIWFGTSEWLNDNDIVIDSLKEVEW